MYRLKTSDGSHTEPGISNGKRVDDPDGTFWIMGQFGGGHGDRRGGQGGIRFKVTG
jgi:hypothetical protein